MRRGKLVTAVNASRIMHAIERAQCDLGMTPDYRIANEETFRAFSRSVIGRVDRNAVALLADMVNARVRLAELEKMTARVEEMSR